MDRQEQMEFIITIVKYSLVVIVIGMFIFFLKYLAKTMATAMNPPVPQVEALGIREDVEMEVPEEVKRSSEMLERVESLTREEPANIANIIRQWLNEGLPSKK